MIISLMILSFGFFLLFTYLVKNGRRSKNYPPGPFSLPIIGNILQLSPEPYVDYMKLRKEYGDIFSIDLGSLKSVILSDYKLLREAYSHTHVSGRPEVMHFNEPGTGLRKGIMIGEGNEWAEQRRFVLKTLRDFGFGKNSMESLVHEEIKEVIEDLKNEVGKPINLNDRFNVAVFNALWTLVAGERHSHSEEKMRKLIRNLTSNTEDFKLVGAELLFPWLAKLMPEFTGVNALLRNNIPVYDFIRDVIAAHRQTYQAGFNRDLVDCYLEQMNKTTDKESTFYGTNADSHFVMTLYGLFLGGTETTSTTLVWMFLMLARHPDIQEKLHIEIKNAVGESRLPSFDDKLNLPYLEAVIMEVMRFSALVPLSMRSTTEDIEFHGYHIPKGTAVVGNLYGINNDKAIWGDPENFRPERFLSADEKKAIKHEALLPFGYGRRFCPGESLARDQIFLFTASLFQRYKVELGPNEKHEKLEMVPGAMMRIPAAHEIILRDRLTE